jgi:glycolate oxidase
MALKRDVFRALKDIVGEENISEDLATLNAYAYHFEFGRCPLAEAVVLPAGTEEVQAIVRICNKHHVRFKPLSTGWGPWNSPGDKGAIQIDLRRLNRIIEINEKNMYAVVEPYVIGAQLQAELLKRGLNCNMIGAGSNTTALTGMKMAGYGWTGISMGVSGRNTLGTEWVTPTGEIIKTGSLSTDSGYFYSEGPGPGLRGLFGCTMGACGGMGICTKGAVKIYHWAGPPEPQIEGRESGYSIKITTDMKMKAWYTHFPSYDKLREALYKIAGTEISYTLSKISTLDIAVGLVETNNEFFKLYNDLQKLITVHGFLIIIVANSAKEFAYGEKVFHRILSETEGKTLQMLEEPCNQGKILWHIIRASMQPQGIFRPTGQFFTSFGTQESIDYSLNQMLYAYKLKKNLAEQGKIMPHLEEWSVGSIYDGGHASVIEHPILRHNTPEGLAGAREFAGQAFVAALDPGLNSHVGGITATPGCDAFYNAVGPGHSNLHLWLRKFKKEFDPQGVSEGNFYVTSENEYQEGPFKLPKPS